MRRHAPYARIIRLMSRTIRRPSRRLGSSEIKMGLVVGRVGGGVTENGVPPSGSTRTVVGQSVAGRAPGVVRSKWRE